MPRPVTLFTGQWADLPFEEVARLASGWGYDGLEIACWGDHFDVAKAAEDPAYVQAKKDTLAEHGLGYEHGFTHQVVDLVAALAAGEQPTPSFADGLQVQRVLDAVERSAADRSTWTSIQPS